MGTSCPYSSANDITHMCTPGVGRACGWRILLPPEAVVDTVAPTALGGSPRGSAGVGEAVAAPTLVEAAIQRTGQQYTTDLRTMLTELREVYEGQIEAKDAALAAKEETIAELRRRAEVAEAELSRHREEERIAKDTNTPQEAIEPLARSWWARLFGKH